MVVLGALLACKPPVAETDADAPLVVFEANVGNPDEALGGPCPASPYHGATCSVAQEEAAAEAIAARNPDVVFLLEVLDPAYCGPETWDGDPDLACTGAPDRDPYAQATRYVGPDYTVVCDAIEHYDCVAVKADRIALEECPAGQTCIGAAESPPHPDACGAGAWITSVSRVHATVDDRPLTIVFAHPIAAGSDDPCRVAQYEQAFAALPEGDTLIAGDMNFDPYRVTNWDASTAWRTYVGEGRPFTAHNVVEGELPLPTILGVATLDYVLSNAFEGGCEVLGESAGTERMDAPLNTMDHRAVVCSLR